MDVVARLRQAGVTRGDLVGLALAPGVALGLAAGPGAWAMRPGPDLAGEAAGDLAGQVAGKVDGEAAGDLAGEVARIDRELRPRWVVWSGETAATLTARQVRLATC